MPPPVSEVIVNPPAPPIEEKKPAPTALVPDQQPTPAPEEAPKTIAKKSTGPGTRRKSTQASKDAPKTITNSIGMKLVLIPAGEFLMGSPDSDKDARDDEKPQHRVRITRPFYLGVTEVTQGQYRAVTGQSPSNFKGSDDLPVEQVSWTDAVAILRQAERAGEGSVGGCALPAPDGGGMGVRLPGGEHDPVQLRRRRGEPGRVRLVQRQLGTARPIRWARSGRTRSGSSTCMGMSGSGVPTGIKVTSTRGRRSRTRCVRSRAPRTV